MADMLAEVPFQHCYFVLTITLSSWCTWHAGNQQAEEEEDLQQFLQQPGTRSHKRGTSPFVFVQWDHIAGSDLNLPVGKTDFYVPG